MIADVAALDAFPDLIAVLDRHDRSWQLGGEGKWYCIDIRPHRGRGGVIPEDCFPVVPLVPLAVQPVRVVLDRHGRLWQLGEDGSWYCIDVRETVRVIPTKDYPLTALAPLTFQPVSAIAVPDPAEETR